MTTSSAVKDDVDDVVVWVGSGRHDDDDADADTEYVTSSRYLTTIRRCFSRKTAAVSLSLPLASSVSCPRSHHVG